MPLDHNDIMELRKVFDREYVRKEECNDNRENVNKKLSNDNTRIELLIQQQKINNWLTTAIAGGIITLVIKIFMGG